MSTRDPGTDPVQSYLRRYGRTQEVQGAYGGSDDPVAAYLERYGAPSGGVAVAPAPAETGAAEEERPGFLRLLADDLMALGRMTQGTNAIIGPGDPQYKAPPKELAPRPGDAPKALRGYTNAITTMGAPAGSAIYHGAAGLLHAAAGEEKPIAAGYEEGIAPAAIRLVGAGDAYQRFSGEHPVASVVGTTVLDALLSMGAEAGVRAGVARGAARLRPKVGEGGESIPVETVTPTPEAAPAPETVPMPTRGRVERGTPEWLQAVDEANRGPLVAVDSDLGTQAAVATRRANELRAPERVAEGDEALARDLSHRLAMGEPVAAPRILGPDGRPARAVQLAPEIEQPVVLTPRAEPPLIPESHRIPARTSGPVIAPGEVGSGPDYAAMPPSPREPLLYGPDGAVRRARPGEVVAPEPPVRKTPPPEPIAPVPTEVAARLAAPGPDLPPAVAARQATPAVPEERLAAPEPPSPRFRSNAANSYAQAAAMAEDPREVFAVLSSAATDAKVGATDRAPLTAFLQQRIDDLGGLPERAPAPRPVEPLVPKAAEPAVRKLSETPNRLAPPERSARITLGAHGARTAEFDDPFLKELFSAVGRASRKMRDQPGLDPGWEMIQANLSRKLGRDVSASEAYQIAKRFREETLNRARATPEDERFSAPMLNEVVEGGNAAPQIQSQNRTPATQLQEAETATPRQMTASEPENPRSSAGGMKEAEPEPFQPGATVGKKGHPLVRYTLVKPTTKANGPSFKGPGWVVRRIDGVEIMVPERELEALPASAQPTKVTPPADNVPDEAPVEAPQRETPAARVEAGARLSGADGKETSVAFPDNSRVQAKWRVVEAGELQPSHDPLSFQRNPRYPEDVQGRDYHRDRAAQENVVTSTAALDPERMLDPTINVGAGTPLVTPDGIAVAGNQRTMMLQRALEHNPKATARYRSLLEERATQFGIDPEAVKGMKNPVLVREIADEGLDLSDRGVLRDLNTRSDMEVGKKKDLLSDAATRAKRLTPDSPSFSHLAETMAPDQTLRSYLRSSAGGHFLDRLVEDGVIGKNEVNSFLDTKGGITDAGAEIIENTLLMAAVGDADVVARAPAGILSKMEHAIPAIARSEGLPGFNLGVGLREALDLLAEKQAKRMASLSDLLSQGDMLTGPREVPPLVERLARFLEDAKPSEVKKAFRGFLTDAQDAVNGQGGLFGGAEPPSFSQLFKQHFTVPGAAGRINNEMGFALTHPLAGLTGGSFGALYGYTQGDTRQERLQNAALYGAAGFALAMGASLGIEQGVRLPRTKDASALKRFADRQLKQGTAWMEGQGEAGAQMARDVRDLTFRVGKRVHNDAADLHAILKGVRRNERELIGKIINRRPVPELGETVPERLQQKAQAIRSVLDRAMNEFGEVGGVRRNLEGRSLGAPKGSGKAFPQVPNEAGREFLKEATVHRGASPRVAALAERMVERGEAVDFEDAVDRIIQYANRGARGVTGYLESTRFELPEELVEWDPAKVLPSLLEKNWRTVEGFRQWGPNMKEAQTLMARMGHQAGADVQQQMERWFKQAFGVSGIQDSASAQLFGAVSNYETISKLGLSLFSVLRNAGQVLTNTADLPFLATAKAYRDLPPIAQAWIKSAKPLKEKLIRSGAVGGRTALSEMENRAPLHHVTNTTLRPFMAQESMNHMRTALAARYALEHDLGELARLRGERGPMLRVWDAVRSLAVDPEGAVSRRLGRMGIDDATAKELLSGKRALTDEEIAKVAWKLNNDRNFTSNLATDPIWWSTSPGQRLLWKFKRYGIEQVKYVWDAVAKEAAKGNLAPLVKFALSTMVVGETYHLARDLVLGEDKSAVSGRNRGGAEIGRRLLKDIADGGGVGMMTDLLWGVGDYIGGPAVSTGKEALSALANVARRPNARQAGMAVGKFLQDEVVVGKQADAAVQGIKRIMGDAGNQYFEAKKLRQRAYDFRDDAENPTVGAKAKSMAVRSLEGLTHFPGSDRTLSYHYAAKQIDVGDVDDAATYLADLVRGAKDREEKASIIEGMYRSADAQAPLGPLNREQEAAFYRSLSGSDRSEARKIDNTWRRNYNRAIRLAIQKARRP